MKKIIILFLLGTNYLNAQTLVSTSPESRKILIERKTGIHCGTCRHHEDNSVELQAAFPGKIVDVGIYTSGDPYGTVHTDKPAELALGNEDATQLAMGSSAVSRSKMNRILFPGAFGEAPYYYGGGTSILYSGMDACADSVFNSGMSPVNIGVETQWDAITRELTVNIEAYFTATVTGQNKLSVYLVESDIIGYQSTRGDNWSHQNVLRKALYDSDIWGDIISNTSAGSLITKTYTYIVPTDYSGTGANIDNMDVIVFITGDDRRNVHTVQKINANKVSTTPTAIRENVTRYNQVQIYPNPIANNANISLSLSKNIDAFSMQVVDIMGRIIYSQDFGALNKGIHRLQWDVTDLAKGLHMMRFQLGDSIVSKPVVIK